MGSKPAPDYTIERNDVDGPYSLSNCRWATRDEQAKNKRDTRYVEFRGHTFPLVDWSRIMHIDRDTLASRLEAGQSPAEALENPLECEDEILTLDGEAMPMSAWAARLGLERTALHSRIAAGWSIRRALTQDVTFKNQRKATRVPMLSKDALLSHEGREQSLEDWAGERGMSVEALKGRIALGWAVGRALDTPVRLHLPRGPREPVRGAVRPEEFVGPSVAEDGPARLPDPNAGRSGLHPPTSVT